TFLEKSLECDKKKHGLNSHNVAVRLGNLASMYDNLGDFEKSIILANKALNIDLGIFDKNSKEVDVWRGVIGNGYKGIWELDHTDLNSLKKAMSYLELVYSNSLKRDGEDDLNTAIEGANLGSIYGIMGGETNDYGLIKKGLRIQKKSLEVEERIWGSLNPFVFTLKNNIASTYQNLGELENAKFYYKASIDDTNEYYNEEGHPSLASYYFNYGVLLFVMRQFTEGIEAMKKGLAIAKSFYGDHHYITNTIENALEKVVNDYNQMNK
ncbi:unnamed protein product, partial [Ectocarpus sp. 12 AP-2014]